MPCPLRFWTSALLVLSVIAHAARSEDARVFALTSNQQHHDLFDTQNHPRLGDLAYREFVRQGLLLAAREEFGLATRDETLLETVDRKSTDTFDVVVSAKAYHGLEIQIARDGQQLLDLYLRDMLEDARAYQVIGREVEQHSRGQFAELLEQAGYKRQPNTWVDSAELPIDVEALLGVMDGISQFRALRAIHKSIRESGESPERLAGLVRGYSNLAQLTIRGIDCRGYAFRCRAWLYAERLLQRTDKSALAEWNWAYMAVLAGLPTPAKEAIARARTANAELMPAWGPLIEQYCSYQFDKLSDAAFEQAENPYSQLATVLWVRATQQLYSKVALLEAGKRAIPAAPHCEWIVDQMFRAAGVSYKRMLLYAGPLQLNHRLTTKLPAVTEVPAHVLDRLAPEPDVLDQNQIAELAREIIVAGHADRQEPSLEVLGRNIEAANLQHAFRNAYVGKVTLGSSSAGYVDMALPAVEGHPLQPLFESFRFNRSHPADAYKPVLKDFAVKDGNPVTGYLLYGSLPASLQLANMSAAQARDLCWFGQMHDEEFIADEAFRVDKIHPTTLDRMQWVSAESPLRISSQVRQNFDGVQGQLEEWLQKYGHYPSIHNALGVAYLDRGDYEKAERHLSEAADRVADYDVLVALARVYYRRDDPRWLEALERILNREDYGLEHAHANGIIADTLISQNNFEDALPYAQEAASSGAGWAMRVECECLTALGKWGQAEQIARAMSRRYRSSAWFRWCIETGQGDLDGAWEAEQDRMQRYDPLVVGNTRAQTFFYLVAKDQDQEALEHIEQVVKLGWRPWYGMLQAQLADAVGDTEQRDQALARLAEWEPPRLEDWSPYKSLAIVIQQAIEEDRPLSNTDIDAVFDGRDDRKKWEGGVLFTAGDFNRLHAEGDQQTEWLKRLATSANTKNWPRNLAWVRLRKEGIDPVHLEGRKFESQLTKAAP